MFYNSKQRKRSLNANEEYLKVVDVVAKYSVHYPLTKFTCKRVEDKKTDVSTHSLDRPAALMASQSEEDQDPMKVIEELNNVRAEIIKRHYGQTVIGKQGELLTLVKFWDVLNMGVNLFLTKPNTVQAKKNTLLLFANNRLVESTSIKKVIDQAYSIVQPQGGSSYFCYMALSVRPDLIDVNVHPTKKQVIIER